MGSSHAEAWMTGAQILDPTYSQFLPAGHVWSFSLAKDTRVYMEHEPDFRLTAMYAYIHKLR
jgi:hypothetical protein